MAARHRLHVILRVPVRVEDDARVGGGEVDANAASARRQQEDKCAVGAVLSTEAIDRGLPRVHVRVAIEPLEAEAPFEQKVDQEVEHHRELREDEHAVPLRLELRQQLVEQHQLARRAEKGVAARTRRHARCGGGLDPLDQVRVVAALAQLHLEVVERRDRRVHHATHEHVTPLLECGAVDLLLEARQLDPHHCLLERRQILLHIALEPPQQVGAHRLSHRLDLLGTRRALRGQAVADAMAVLSEEGWQRGELRCVEEVAERPQLARVVLERRAAQQVEVRRLERAQVGRERRVLALEAVGLVDDHVAPRNLPELRQLVLGHLVRRDEHVKLGRRSRHRRAASSLASSRCLPPLWLCTARSRHPLVVVVAAVNIHHRARSIARVVRLDDDLTELLDRLLSRRLRHMLDAGQPRLPPQQLHVGRVRASPHQAARLAARGVGRAAGVTCIAHLAHARLASAAPSASLPLVGDHAVRRGLPGVCCQLGFVVRVVLVEELVGADDLP